MNKLINANISRLLKSKLLIFGVLASFLGTMWYICDGAKVLETVNLAKTPIEQMKLVMIGIPAFMSVFSALFIGTEHSDHTIRNKLIAGHSKKNIYMANYISIVMATIIMILAWLCGGIIATIMTGNEVLIKELMTYTIIALFFNISYSAILTFISMLITNKAVSAAIQILLVQNSITICLFTYSISTFATGVANKVFITILNILPFGQWFSLTSAVGDEAALNGWIQLIISIAITVLFTVLGLNIFNKKGIK